MAHFAQLDDNNTVITVIVVANKDICDANGVEKESIGIAHCEKIFGGKWIQVSYNSNFRGTYPGKGSRYFPEHDTFSPKPFASWTRNQYGRWDPPSPMPTETPQEGNVWGWNEDNLQWEEVEDPNYIPPEADPE